MAGIVLEPVNGQQCPGGLEKWRYDFCPKAVPCAQRANCVSCAMSPGCGWCPGADSAQGKKGGLGKCQESAGSCKGYIDSSTKSEDQVLDSCAQVGGAAFIGGR